MEIHPLAVVSPAAVLGHDVRIGPFSIVGEGAVIGDGCQLASRVVVKQGTRLGPRNQVFEGVVLGGLPQHAKMSERPGGLVIGANNVIRENVTIHRAFEEPHATTIGDGNLLMVNVHVAHDCQLGNHTILANNAMLAGHVTIEDRAYISGAVGVHQFCRIGTLAMVGGQAHVNRDVPPFVTVDGVSTRIVGLNRVGLRRAGFTAPEIDGLKRAYQLIYRSGLLWSDIMTRLAGEFASGPAARFHEFFAESARGCLPARTVPMGAIPLREEVEEEPPAPRIKVG
jgi:UDP-N-acetylglucosamine acyltransferase